MAALSDASVLTMAELRQIRAEQLDDLLNEESQVWSAALDWDFRPSADLVRRFVGMKSLSGFALTHGDTVAGYAYYVAEEHKGLVGDLYVRDRYRSIENENRLLEQCVAEMMRSPLLGRVEAQLMLLPSPLDRAVPFADLLSVHQRDFMEIDAAGITQLPMVSLPAGVHLETWSSRRQEQAARVITAAYSGHVDSAINDQYRSLAGARRFLVNIIQYPGCGSFFTPGSFVATDSETHEVLGISLASLVAPDVGHITQICVEPGERRRGLGYELLRHSLEGLRGHGCRKASLTVTAENQSAVELYRRCGFRLRRSFGAYVWESFR